METKLWAHSLSAMVWNAYHAPKCSCCIPTIILLRGVLCLVLSCSLLSCFYSALFSIVTTSFEEEIARVDASRTFVRLSWMCCFLSFILFLLVAGACCDCWHKKYINSVLVTTIQVTTIHICLIHPCQLIFHTSISDHKRIYYSKPL